MSTLFDKVESHDEMHSYYSRQAVKQIQRGDASYAGWLMEQAAMERHLAYELHDVWRISLDAVTAYGRGRLMERGRDA